MFRFTIRELVLVTVIVAVCASWWIDHARLKADQKAQELDWALSYSRMADNTVAFAKVQIQLREALLARGWDVIQQGVNVTVVPHHPGKSAEVAEPTADNEPKAN